MKRRPYRKKPPQKRFWAKVDKTDACWLWTAHCNQGGYGRFWTGTEWQVAHRFAYELLVGPIPKGLDLDHLCRVRHCVNPTHLEPVTRAENLRRGTPPRREKNPKCAQWQRTKTHCPRGHEYTPENTYVLPSRPNARYCRTCHREQTRERRKAQDESFSVSVVCGRAQTCRTRSLTERKDTDPLG